MSLGPLGFSITDNAAYAGSADLFFALMPFTQTGTPFAMHRSVIAHEFGHRVFQQNVYPTDEALRASLKLDDQSPQAQRAGRLLSGLNEGLSDLFAVGMAGDASAIASAFQGPPGSKLDLERLARDLDGAFAQEITYQKLMDGDLPKDHLQRCSRGHKITSDIADLDDFNFYCFGTLVARTLWETAGDSERLRSVVLPAVQRGLPRLGAELLNERLFGADLFLEVVASELPASERAHFCAKSQARFGALVATGVPSCS